MDGMVLTEAGKTAFLGCFHEREPIGRPSSWSSLLENEFWKIHWVAENRSPFRNSFDKNGFAKIQGGMMSVDPFEFGCLH